VEGGKLKVARSKIREFFYHILHSALYILKQEVVIDEEQKA
jgi:hypothetical protein